MEHTDYCAKQTSAFQFQTVISSSNDKGTLISKRKAWNLFRFTSLHNQNDHLKLFAALCRSEIWVLFHVYCLIFLEIFHSIMVLLLGSSIPCYWRRSRLIVFSAFRDNNSKLKEVGTIQVLVSQKPCLSFGCLFFASIVAFERSRN